MKCINKVLIGIVIGIGILAAQTVLSVQPASISDRDLMPGDTFTVNIYVENVTGLYAYQWSLHYKPDVLVVDGFTPGPFLSQGGITWPMGRANGKCGWLMFGESIQGASSGVSGSGVLTYVRFRVNKKGKSHIDLSYLRSPYMANMLLNSTLSDIGFTTLTGEFSNE